MDGGAVQNIERQAYCRQARRLRAIHAGDPVRLHRRLHDLSMRRDLIAFLGAAAPARVKPLAALPSGNPLDAVPTLARRPFYSRAATALVEPSSSPLAEAGDLTAHEYETLHDVRGKGAAVVSDPPTAGILARIYAWLRAARRGLGQVAGWSWLHPRPEGFEAARAMDDDEASRATLMAAPQEWAGDGEPGHGDAASGAADEFGRRVRATLEANPDGAVLRYSRRLELLRDARRRGIGRFEANLIIAAAQHKLAARSPQRVTGRFPKPARIDPGPCGFTTALLGFVAIQSLIVTAAWWVVRS
jgi:hypothetical protein